MAAGLKPAEKGVDPFGSGLKNVGGGFMKDLMTRGPKPGTDGTEGYTKRQMATSA